MPSPVAVHAVRVPRPRQAPELFDAEHAAALGATLRAPAVNVLLRPEEQHRCSGVADVVPPARRRHREVTDIVFRGIDRVSGHTEVQRCVAVWTPRLDLGGEASIAAIPSESQMQLPKYRFPAACTRNGVSTADSGFNIQRFVVPGWSTSTRPSARRLNEASTSAADVPSRAATEAAVGALPVETNDSYNSTRISLSVTVRARRSSILPRAGRQLPRPIAGQGHPLSSQSFGPTNPYYYARARSRIPGRRAPRRVEGSPPREHRRGAAVGRRFLWNASAEIVRATHVTLILVPKVGVEPTRALPPNGF